jgi:peptidoglycan hydrolase-like protein with peptidoglycan-binding domain
MTETEIPDAEHTVSGEIDGETAIAASNTERTEKERRALEERRDELERGLLEVEAELVHEIDTAPNEGDPEQPESGPALAEAEVLRTPLLTADRIIARALSKRGYTEESKDNSFFGRWYGLNPAAWCAMFVSWVFHEEGMPLPAHTRKGFAYCGYGVSWFKKAGRWHGARARPKPGWVVFYDWPKTTKEPFDHVGVVHSVNKDGSINAIEGNTANPTTLRDRPRGVHIRTRRAGILGYGEPRYAAAPSPSTLPREFKLLKQNASGSLVRRMQGLVRAADPGLTDATLAISGKFDATTLAKVRAFQKSQGLTVDGEVGENTWRALLGLPKKS